jgi:glyoxylase-like metal-dependent hydrolase (beta-lactamase superfamily II)
MQGTVSLTHGDKVTIHTYTAPELGWRANTHIVELPTEMVLFDAQLTPAFAREVVGITTALNKPITRLYISHAHPDHFAGATEIDAPTYALAEVKELIDRSGNLRIKRGYQYTPGHANAGPITSRPIDHVVEAGEEVIDEVRFSFEPVNDAETTEQLAIGLPDEGILIAPDVLYHGVHLFIGEHNFDRGRPHSRHSRPSRTTSSCPVTGSLATARSTTRSVPTSRSLAMRSPRPAGPRTSTDAWKPPSPNTGEPQCRGFRTSTCSPHPPRPRTDHPGRPDGPRPANAAGRNDG